MFSSKTWVASPLPKLNWLSPQSSSPLSANRALGAKLFLITIFTMLGLLILNQPPPQHSRQTCQDPFSQLGSLFLHPTQASQTNWIPFNSNCPPATNYISAIRQLSNLPIEKESQFITFSNITNLTIFRDTVHFLRNRTILVLGDSVDRNSVIHFCQLISQPVRITSWKNASKLAPFITHPHLDSSHLAVPPHGSDLEGFDIRGLPHVCFVEELDFVFLNGFHYGMDDQNLFNSSQHPDWRPPGKFEDRIDKLIKPYLNQAFVRPRSPDLVIWSSGFWDLAFFGTKDELSERDLTTQLSPQRLNWWFARAKKTLLNIKSSFPNALLVMRKIHRPGATTEQTRWMQDIRVHQIQQAQEFISSQFEFYKIFDFGRLFEGYEKYQENVHPFQNPSSIIAQAYLHYLKLAVNEKLI
ncbi:hypothetical protein O181_052298 [Austropuccinia psidii MF-1]|uniref:Uncharacterized protein n=1 Tax=Austropuccinia psidii MF-1 TaxID=1389203 RepID=A0A9Q3E2C6_9BASI|nr:hypothetical protein [Austropuccinia psidii MF-1]